ncbi:alpha/beta hydrolase [Nocardia sp. CDC159]|uniref:Alpha/beta hydrolase n=1 Tax=Nocardia pulmonis TaxID=2951408 RepID=A0A9X2E3Q6_9NOCA|nr:MULTISPECIES: alpha/beta fold hydrolase [Nocardia]MCM6773567.1 alpha/beta hydrolase [Nocardia pulmonis]MCM6786454.1 alpha/beta hydrolase [Nocardia sp. CDC159]
MRGLRKSVSLVLAVAVVGGVLAGCGGGSNDSPPTPAWCPTVPDRTVQCGVLARPLVADRPELGEVQVGYALVRREHGDRPSAGTIVPNPGGPGVPMISHAPEAVALSSALLDDHDLLLIDPRGTGVSSPIDCEVTEREFQLGTREQQIQAAQRCGERLGPRAAGYTTAATADDFDAVRARLGIDKLVLYGISYGTYLMPVYAQRHPDHVQSIVLTGAYPAAFDKWQRPNAEAVSLTLRRICERSRACDPTTAVADLRATAQRLREQPIAVDGPNPVLLTESKLANLIFEDATSNVGIDPTAPTPLGMLPAALHAAVAGDDGPLREFTNQITAHAPYEKVGAYIAVTCNDYPQFWSPEATVPQREQQYRQALAQVPELGAFSGEGFAAAQRDHGDVCLRWTNASNPRPDQMREPMPNVPVLVLSGDLDAVTPDANGKLAAARFARSTFVSVPNTGHVPDLEPSGCVVGLVNEFVRTGAIASTACVQAIPPIAVTPVAR